MHRYSDSAPLTAMTTGQHSYPWLVSVLLFVLSASGCGQIEVPIGETQEIPTVTWDVSDVPDRVVEGQTVSFSILASSNGTKLTTTIDAGPEGAIYTDQRLTWTVDKDYVQGKWSKLGLTQDATFTITAALPDGNSSSTVVTVEVANDLDGDGLADSEDDDDDGDALGDEVELSTGTQPDNPDTDSDEIQDGTDNCPLAPNQDQADADYDMVGNACDEDDDNDNVLDVNDNCPLLSNPSQDNTDGDAEGDECDDDDDNDDVLDTAPDNCPKVANTNQQDTDLDTLGDVCDPNIDNDIHPNVSDNCPSVSNDDQANLDGDSLGDACDDDRDGDGILNARTPARI